MPLPKKDFVQQVLSKNDRAARIFGAVERAWINTLERHPERALWQRKATFRGVVWEAIVRELTEISLHDHGFKRVLHQDTASFILDNTILFRLKHAEMSLATSNYPTREALAYDDHSVDLYGLSDLQRVELCYVPNEFETKIAWVGISARSNGKHLWKIELDSKGVTPEKEISLFDADINPQNLVRFIATPSGTEKQNKSDGTS